MSFHGRRFIDLTVFGAAVLATLASGLSEVRAQEPTYGELVVPGDIGDGFVSLGVAAGGSDPAANLSPECAGFINGEAPDVSLVIERATTRVHVYVSSTADTTLVVQRPNGSFMCNDDNELLNLNPMVELLKPGAGVYSVWIGSLQGQLADAMLYASIAPPDWSALAAPGGVEAAPAPSGDLASGTPRFGTITLDSADSAAPRKLEVIAGGSFAAGEIDISCSGMIDNSMPDVHIEVPAGFGALTIDATSDSDTTLIVRDPLGSLYCNDDMLGPNPQISTDDAASGTWEVWVGSFGSSLADATLTVSGQGRADASTSSASSGTTASFQFEPITVAPTNSERAAAVATGIVDALNLFSSSMAADPSTAAVMATSAPVIATDDGSTVTVILPDLVANTRDGITVRFGSPQIDVVPGNDGTMAWTASLGRSLTVWRGDEKLAEITWREEEIEGVHVERFGTSPRFEARLGGITALVMEEPDFRGTIDAIRLFSDLEPSSGGGDIYSGDSGFEMDGLDFSAPEGAMKLRRVAVSARTDLVDLVAMKRFNDIVQGLSATGGEPDLAAMLAAFSQLSIGAGRIEMTAEGFDFTEAGGESVALGRMSYSVGVDGREELGSVSLGFAMSDFAPAIEGWPDSMKPDNVEIAIEAARLPLRELFALVSDPSALTPEGQALLGQQAMLLMLQAGPELRLTSLDLSAPAVGMGGEARVALTPAMAPEGGGRFTLRGLPEMIAELSRNPLTQAEAAEMVPLFLMVQGLGRPDPSDPAVLVYEVEIGPNMSILVNGLDLSSLPQ